MFPLNYKFLHGFPVSRKSEARDRRTDGRDVTLNAAHTESRVMNDCLSVSRESFVLGLLRVTIRTNVQT